MSERNDEIEWTTDEPTVSGWYWIYGEGSVWCTLVETSPFGLFHHNIGWYPTHWKGPMRMPPPPVLEMIGE